MSRSFFSGIAAVLSCSVGLSEDCNGFFPQVRSRFHMEEGQKSSYHILNIFNLASFLLTHARYHQSNCLVRSLWLFPPEIRGAWLNPWWRHLPGGEQTKWVKCHKRRDCYMSVLVGVRFMIEDQKRHRQNLLGNLYIYHLSLFSLRQVFFGSCQFLVLIFCFSAFLTSLLFPAFPASLLFAFPASLLFCILISLLLCFSASLFSLLLCFCIYFCFLLFWMFFFFSHVFLQLYFLLLCFFASCLYSLFVFVNFFCCILSCLYPEWNPRKTLGPRWNPKRP